MCLTFNVGVIPKMLRVYFLHQRQLLGELPRAACETVRDLMAAAASEEETPGRLLPARLRSKLRGSLLVNGGRRACRIGV